jgi:acyl-CoA reductase-like NAD-dependent aldehyde dehydrogenase
MRAGNVHLNYPVGDTAALFGGYKQSGNGTRPPDPRPSGVTPRPTA